MTKTWFCEFESHNPKTWIENIFNLKMWVFTKKYNLNTQIFVEKTNQTLINLPLKVQIWTTLQIIFSKETLFNTALAQTMIAQFQAFCSLWSNHLIHMDPSI